MNVEQIMKLIDAGFTKEEIMGFSAPSQEPAQEPARAREPEKEMVSLPMLKKKRK